MVKQCAPKTSFLHFDDMPSLHLEQDGEMQSFSAPLSRMISSKGMVSSLRVRR